MTLTKSQFLDIQPSYLTQQAQVLQSLFSDLNEYSNDLTKTDSSAQLHFQGKAADILYEETSKKLKKLSYLHQSGSELCTALTDAGFAATSAWQSLRDFIHHAEQNGFLVTDDWKIRSNVFTFVQTMHDVSRLQNVSKELRERLSRWYVTDSSMAKLILQSANAFSSLISNRQTTPEQKTPDEETTKAKKIPYFDKAEISLAEKKFKTGDNSNNQPGPKNLPGKTRKVDFSSTGNKYKKDDQNKSQDSNSSRKLGGKIKSGNVGAAVLKGEDEQKFLGSHLSTKESGEVLSVSAGGSAGLNKDGLNLTGNAQANLAKGSVSGVGSLGPLQVGASGTAAIDANVSGTINLSTSGVNLNAGAFAGAEASASVNYGVKGFTSETTAGLTAGIGMSGSLNCGIGDDHKFHLGFSGQATLGIGGKVTTSLTIDPVELENTTKDIYHYVDPDNHIVNSVQPAIKSIHHDVTHAIDIVQHDAGEAAENINREVIKPVSNIVHTVADKMKEINIIPFNW